MTFLNRFRHEREKTEYTCKQTACSLDEVEKRLFVNCWLVWNLWRRCCLCVYHHWSPLKNLPVTSPWGPHISRSPFQESGNGQGVSGTEDAFLYGSSSHLVPEFSTWALFPLTYSSLNRGHSKRVFEICSSWLPRIRQ